jgi:UDPglucose--hexose-1-phosphate uridylyltransferase
MRIDPLTGLRAIVSKLDGAAPLLNPDSPDTAPEANRDLFWTGPARGSHEVLEAPSGPLSALGVDELSMLLEGWRERMRAYADAAYLHLVAEDPGPVIQLFALDFVPAAIARERERFGAYATRTMGGNLLADLLQEEVRRRERVVAIDDECVLLAPFAARVPYQLMVVPRRPRPRFEDAGPTGAGIVREGLARLRRVLGDAPAFSLWVRTAPSGAEHFCWRLDILPRTEPADGLELGTGVPVNPVSPESAAARLREV